MSGSISPATVIYDANGNPVSIINDSGVYRISGVTKVLNSSNTQINPATQETLESIKDTDGIKKITDALPTGTNTIGNIQITDDGGTTIADIVTDNSIDRLETRSSIVGQTAGTGSEKKVCVIDDIEDSSVKRLQTQALLAPGSTVNIGTSIPADPANLTIEFLENGDEDMLVDGSVTPVEFSYAPASGVVIAIESLLVVFTADDFEFNGVSFGPNTGMTNGISFRLTVSPSSEVEIFNIKINEDFLRVPGRVPIVNNTGPKDLLSSVFSFGGLIKLNGTNGDKISAYVRDDLTSVKFKYLTATVYGAEV
jgi:hypothetical protein